jgi:VCBS repeat protein/type IX secretion system substrate protein
MKKITNLLLFLLCANVVVGQFGPQNDVSRNTSDVRDVKAFDLDGDGDIDILSASRNDGKIAWYENLGGGSFSNQQIITINTSFTRSVYAADLDGDGDLDVLSASSGDNKIAWYKNLGGGVFSSQQIISVNANVAVSVYASDLDGDGDVDVLSASQGDNKITWYENLGGGSFGIQHTITTNANGAISVFTADLDNDGDEDVLSASAIGDNIAWYENLGGGSFGIQQIISNNTNGASSVFASDLDGDGDFDVLSSSSDNNTSDHKIAWYENFGGGVFGPQQIINSGTSVSGASSVYATDINGDGKIDVLSASKNVDKIAWYENLGGGAFGVEQIISSNAIDANSVVCADIDNDGKTDVISGSSGDNKVAWYKNLGGGSFGMEQIITNQVGNGARSVHSADINNDGYNDILSASSVDGKIAWFKNLGNNSFDTARVITTDVGVLSIYAIDLDGDGDIDVLSASYLFPNSKISWHENLGSGIFGPQQIISTTQDKPIDVYASDLDNDGDFDVLSASMNDNKISWYENLGGGNFSIENIVTTIANGAQDVHTSDLDGDGDMDILSASSVFTNPPTDERIAWYENLGNGVFGPQQLISTSIQWGYTVQSADLDNDGDQDILSTSYLDDKISWYENLGNGVFGSGQILTTNLDGPESIYPVDIDNDGDIDILASSNKNPGEMIWIENLGGGNFNIGSIIEPFSRISRDIYATDLDNDGDLEVISAYQSEDKVVWYENYFGGFNQIKGKIFHDVNQNGINDSSELGLSLTQVSLQPNGIVSYTNSGDYIFTVDSGTYNVQYSLDTLWKLTTDSTSYSVTLNSGSPVIDSLDFGLYPDTFITAINPILTGGFPRCNSIINYWVNIRNKGTTLPSGTIMLELDSSITFVISDIAPDSITSQNIYWHFDSLFYYSEKTIQLQVQMPNFQSAGNSLFNYLVINEIDSLGNTIYSSSDTLEQTLVCAYDPNDKTVNPKGLGSNGYVLNDSELEYLIRFQNTGNDTAITIMIRDQLDEKLDWNSLQPIASSHVMQVWIEQDGEAVFKFENIMLPDSNVNEMASHGFVKFKINMKPNLLPENIIHNTSHIYFDFNPAVITNTVLNTIYDCNKAPIKLLTSTTCKGEQIKAYSPEGGFNNYTWEIDTFYTSTTITDTLIWVSDTVGTFNLKMTISNELCSKDTTVSITVSPAIPLINNNTIICQGDSLLIYGNYQNIAGTYYDTLQAVIGCDSVISTTLTVNSSYLFTQNQSICQGDSVLIYGNYQSIAGTYYDSLQTINGCDSVLSTTLTIDSSYLFNQNQSICQGDSILIYGNYENTAGIYYDSLQTINGCDSMLSITLSVNPVYLSNTYDTICQGDSIFLYGQYQNVAGTYYDSLQTINGCDSVLSTTLTIDSSYLFNQNQSICQGDSMLIYGNYQSVAGTYYDSLQTINGCDSVLSITLSVNPVYLSNTNDTICQGDSVLIYGNYENTAGVYYDTLQTIFGCDSVLATTLSLNANFNISQNQSVCQGDSVLIYGNYQSVAGTYYDSLQTINGCDSVLLTTLTVNPLPNVTLSNFNPDTICSNSNAVTLPNGSPSGGVYSGTGVSGGTFDPNTAGIGTHSVFYTYTDINSCINSDSTFITVEQCVGMDDLANDLGILIYPNPNTGLFTIEKSSELDKEVNISLLDASSRVVIDKVIPKGQQKIEMDITNYSKGVYYLQMTIGDKVYVKQILKN